MSDTVGSLIAYCREHDRVCPLPSLWNRLWEMLPNRTLVDAGWQPPPPLILAAWHDTPAMLKRLRFASLRFASLRLAEHIEWAAQYGALELVSNFLHELREEDWFHIGE